MLAAILFGALYQGGFELSLDMPNLTRDMVVVIQGLIILVCGALEHALRRPIEALFRPAPRAADRAKASEAHDPPVSLGEIASLAIGAWILGTGWRMPYLALLNRYRPELCCGPVPFDV